MKPTILYLYIFSLLALFLFVSASDSDSNLIYREEFDPEIKNFNENLDKASEAISAELKVAVEKLRAEKKKAHSKIKQNPKHNLHKVMDDDVTAEEINRLRRKISAKYFRNYDNFNTLEDGTFFGNMFTPNYQMEI